MEALAFTATLVQLVEGALLLTKETRNMWISYRHSQREFKVSAKRNSVLENLLAEATSVREQLRTENGLGKQANTRNVYFNIFRRLQCNSSDTADM